MGFICWFGGGRSKAERSVAAPHPGHPVRAWLQLDLNLEAHNSICSSWYPNRSLWSLSKLCGTHSRKSVFENSTHEPQWCIWAHLWPNGYRGLAFLPSRDNEAYHWVIPVATSFLISFWHVKCPTVQSISCALSLLHPCIARQFRHPHYLQRLCILASLQINATQEVQLSKQTPQLPYWKKKSTAC